MLHEPKFLVISTVGDQSLHRYWSKSKMFDTCLIYYGDNKGYEGDSKYYKRAKGPKFHLIQDMLNENPKLKEYTYIWMPDDDVYTSVEDVERLFQLNLEYNLWISQPSIVGWYGTTVPLHTPGYILRYTNWVEIMCPVFSKHALKKCMKTFKENITGWSIDAAWNVILDHPKDKIAIIDDVIAIHTREVFGGDVYDNLKKGEKITEAWKDSHKVRVKYSLTEEMAKDNGQRLGQGEIFNVVMYSGVEKQMENELCRKKRFWPQIETLDLLIKKIKNPQNLI